MKTAGYINYQDRCVYTLYSERCVKQTIKRRRVICSALSMLERGKDLTKSQNPVKLVFKSCKWSNVSCKMIQIEDCICTVCVCVTSMSIIHRKHGCLLIKLWDTIVSILWPNKHKNAHNYTDNMTVGTNLCNHSYSGLKKRPRSNLYIWDRRVRSGKINEDWRPKFLFPDCWWLSLHISFHVFNDYRTELLTCKHLVARCYSVDLVHYSLLAVTWLDNVSDSLRRDLTKWDKDTRPPDAVSRSTFFSTRDKQQTPNETLLKVAGDWLQCNPAC